MTRETSFKRAAKVSLSIRKPDRAALREALVSAIKPMVDYFAAELTALAMRRLDDELARIGEAVHVAVSAFATEVEAPQQLPVKGQTSDIPARAETAESKSAGHVPVPEAEDSSRGAPRASGNGDVSRPLDQEMALRRARFRCGCRCSFCVEGACDKCAAPPGLCPYWVTEVPAKVTVDFSNAPSSPGLIESALGADIARALGEPVVDRDVKPHNVAPPAAKPKNGVRRCSKCGTVGHYARSCRREVPSDRTPVVPPPPSPKVDRADRLATLKARNADLSADDKPLARAGEDDEEIAEQVQAAEAQKLGGELPIPRSSWEF